MNKVFTSFADSQTTAKRTPAEIQLSFATCAALGDEHEEAAVLPVCSSPNIHRLDV